MIEDFVTVEYLILTEIPLNVFATLSLGYKGKFNIVI